MAEILKKATDPVYRSITPSPDPQTLNPRSQQLASGSNYHSSSLRNMVSNTVNKTALHPGGVQ
jgi:hypothetical protein